MAKIVSNDTISHSSSDDVLPVLIVGAGPVGLTLAILLTKLGVKCGIIERRKTFSQHPQAHIINNRSMEVFCKLDNLSLEIQNLQPPVEQWSNFVYCTSLFGSILGSVNHVEPKDLEQVVSPVFGAHLSQYKLNKLLLEKIQHLGFRVCMSEELKSPSDEHIVEGNILMEHECTSTEATDHGVMVGVSYLKNGEKVERNILCSILVGADGVGSVVRKLQRIKMIGERDMHKFVSVHFMSKDLGDYLLNERPGMLYFIFNADIIAILVAHNLSKGEFVMQIPMNPPRILKDFTPEVCKELTFKLTGRKLEDIDVLGIKPWVMHAEVAEKFVSSNNRVILVGDAAHRFPPVGGLGMNTGIQDAHNLAWKLAYLVKGIAPSSILRTYETERRPIGLFNTALSVKNLELMAAIPAALGLDPTVGNIGLEGTILDGIFSNGRAQVSDENNPFGSSKLEKVKRIFDEGKSLQLLFPAEDLGFRYFDGALVCDGDTSQNVPETPTGRKNDYIPLAEPGARLPHMRVRMLRKLTSEEKLSTLDLVSSNKLEFLLIIAPVKDSYDLAKAAFKVAEGFRIGLKVCVMWSQESMKRKDGSKDSLAPWENYVDVEEVKGPSSSSWWQICKMTEKSAILVRPDDHIAWRAKDDVPADPVMEMGKVFSQILGVERNPSW